MKTLDLIRLSQKTLQSVSQNPYQESLWILSDILNISPTCLYLPKYQEVHLKHKKIFFHKLHQRRQGLPIDYILEEKWFMGLKFCLHRGVFIPRADSEILVQCALNHPHPIRALDLGAGAGTLCLSVLHTRSDSHFVAAEIHSPSLKCLYKNSLLHQVSHRLKILKKDVLHLKEKDFLKFLKGRPNLILANPPYVQPLDASISPEVYKFESPLALFSNQEGMGHIYSWFNNSIDFLESKGRFIFEFGYDQLDKVKAFLIQREDLKSFSIVKDQSGLPRAVVCEKK